LKRACEIVIGEEVRLTKTDLAPVDCFGDKNICRARLA